MAVSPAHLRTLHEIARLGSFSRAADSLHLSQPAVSLHVRQLEDGLGLPLLERMGRRAALTRAGAVLLEHGGRALDALEAAAARVRALRGVVAGRVRVGTGATASIYLLPPILRRLRARYPDLELVIVTGNTPEIAKAVAENALDVAVVTLPVRSRQLVVTPFYTDRLVIEGWFRRGRVTPRVAMELGNGEAIKELVSAGLGPSITSAISVRAEARAGTLRVIPLSPPLVRRLGIIRRRDKPLSPPLQALLQALQRRARRGPARERPAKLARGRRPSRAK